MSWFCREFVALRCPQMGSEVPSWGHGSGHGARGTGMSLRARFAGWADSGTWFGTRRVAWDRISSVSRIMIGAAAGEECVANGHAHRFDSSRRAALHLGLSDTIRASSASTRSATKGLCRLGGESGCLRFFEGDQAGGELEQREVVVVLFGPADQDRAV